MSEWIVSNIKWVLIRTNSRWPQCVRPERAYTGSYIVTFHLHPLSHWERFRPYSTAVFSSGYPLSIGCSSFYLTQRDGRLSQSACSGNRTRILSPGRRWPYRFGHTWAYLSHVVADLEDGSLPIIGMVIAARGWYDGRPTSRQSRGAWRLSREICKFTVFHHSYCLKFFDSTSTYFESW
jgi:hypothetical protein